jgi:hypothetical protein
MSTESERKQILMMVESGKITPSQGVKLLHALDDNFVDEPLGEKDLANPERADLSSVLPTDQDEILAEKPVTHVEENIPIVPAEMPVENNENAVSQTAEKTSQTPKVDDAPDFTRWRRWIMIPLWTGVVLTILGGILMYSTWMASRSPSFWFACSWIPFLVGIGLMVLAWSGRSVRWLYICIQQKTGEWPQRIAIILPLPLKLLAWIMRTFGKHIPIAENNSWDEMILALKNTSPDALFRLDIHGGEEGERVQVFIG